MPDTSKSISKTADQRWQSPLTPSGQRLGEPDFAVQVHEVGCARFGPEWNHRAVCSPYWRLYYNFDEGSGIRSAGKEWALTPRVALLVPEGVTFDCVGGSSVRHLWIHFSTRPSVHQPITEIGAGEPLRGLLLQLRNELERAPREERRLQRWSASVVQAALGLSEVEAATPHPRLRAVLLQIENGLGGSLKNDELARVVGLSVEAFIRWFRDATGRTPAAFVAQERVREASRRLAFTDDSIEAVAEAVGFANRHHFTRVFTRYAGCAPAAFRRSVRP